MSAPLSSEPLVPLYKAFWEEMQTFNFLAYLQAERAKLEGSAKGEPL